MFIIKKDSWLHRFNQACSFRPTWWWDEQENLCNYFWASVFVFLKVVLMGGFVITLLSTLGSGILDTVFNINVNLTENWWMFFPCLGTGIAVITAIACLAVSIVGLGILFKMFINWLDNKYFSKRVKKPSMIGTYVSAKKQKYCPRMKVE